LESRFGHSRQLPSASWARDFFRPRYVSLGISLFLAMYVGLKFMLVVFNAADAFERWTFELTPGAVLNLPDIQLALLAAFATIANAFLHYSTEQRHRRWAILLAASMVAGLLLALRGASTDLDPVNTGRLASLVLLLGMVSLDNVDLLRRVHETPEDFVTSELRTIAEHAKAAGSVTPGAVAQALRELEALVRDLPEGPAARDSSKTSSLAMDEDYLRELMTSVLRDSGEPGDRGKGATRVHRREARADKSDEEETLEEVEKSGERPGLLRGRLARSPAYLMDEARRLTDAGEFEKALRRLDRIADLDDRYPGLWELAAEVYDRLGEPVAAAECRRRAQETSP
jgi:tetratricopeptide (TPR) repeat protein